MSMVSYHQIGRVCILKIQETRSRVANYFVMGDPMQMASVIWLSVGKTHYGMQEFRMTDFKHHSSNKGEYIKCMCQNNNSDEISTYKSDLTDLETKTNSMKTDFKLKIRNVTAKAGVNLGNRVK